MCCSQEYDIYFFCFVLWEIARNLGYILICIFQYHTQCFHDYRQCNWQNVASQNNFYLKILVFAQFSKSFCQLELTSVKQTCLFKMIFNDNIKSISLNCCVYLYTKIPKDCGICILRKIVKVYLLNSSSMQLAKCTSYRSVYVLAFPVMLL